MRVAPGEIVKTQWVSIDRCKLGCRERMDFAAIERAGRKYLQVSYAQFWPPIVGEWDGERFVVLDGRHEFVALLAMGRTEVFVAWKERD